MTKIDLVRDCAIRDTMEKMNSEFKQVSEMDKMLGLAGDDPLKTTLKEILPKYTEEFAASIDQKGVNTTTEASIKEVTKKYLEVLIRNILDSYKESGKDDLIKLIEFVQPYAIKVVVACETGEETKPAATLKDMLKQCVDRFCDEYKNK